MTPRRFIGDSQLKACCVYCKLRPFPISCFSGFPGWLERAIISLSLKEFLNQSRAFLGKDAGADFRSMIEPRMTKQITDRAGHARLFVPCAEHDALHARQQDGTRTHRARLEGHVYRAIIESPAIELRRRLANCQELGVGSGILISNGPVCGGGKDRPIAHDDRADRNFVAFYRFAREIQRVSDVLFIRRQPRREAKARSLLMAI